MTMETEQAQQVERDSIMADVMRAASEPTPEPQEGSPSAPAEPVPAAQPEAKVPEAPAQAGTQRDASGRFAPKSEAEAPTPEQAQPAQPGQPQTAPAQETAPPTPKRKAPQAWRATAREKWDALPPEVQEEVARLDSQLGGQLREAATWRRAAEEHQALQQALAPYRAIMRGSPAEYLPRVMATVSALQVGTPADKARTVVQLMREFAVPPEEMVRVLDGAEPAQAQQPAPYRDSRLDQLLAVAAQRQQYQQQQQRAQVAQTLDQFEAQAEFIAEPGMRETMAALLGGGAAKDLPDAYDKACQLSPEVRRILEQRKTAQAVTASQAATQRAQVAASSIRSSPAGIPPPSGSGRVLDDVHAAAAALSRR